MKIQLQIKERGARDYHPRFIRLNCNWLVEKEALSLQPTHLQDTLLDTSHTHLIQIQLHIQNQLQIYIQIQIQAQIQIEGPCLFTLCWGVCWLVILLFASFATCLRPFAWDTVGGASAFACSSSLSIECKSVDCYRLVEREHLYQLWWGRDTFKKKSQAFCVSQTVVKKF